MSLAETTAIPLKTLFPKELPPLGFGLATTLQLLPSQCSTSVWTGPVLVSPAAQTLLDAIAVTDQRTLSKAGLGADTLLQDLPSKCRTSTLGWRNDRPTAQMSVLEVPETPRSPS